jgi:hypothetical protein
MEKKEIEKEAPHSQTVILFSAFRSRQVISIFVSALIFGHSFAALVGFYNSTLGTLGTSSVLSVGKLLMPLHPPSHNRAGWVSPSLLAPCLHAFTSNSTPSKTRITE